MMKMGKNDGTKQTNERNGEGAFFIIPLIILLCKLRQPVYNKVGPERKKDKTIKLQTDVQLSNRTVGCLCLNKQTTRSRRGTSQGEFLGADNEDLPVNNDSNTL